MRYTVLEREPANTLATMTHHGRGRATGPAPVDRGRDRRTGPASTGEGRDLETDPASADADPGAGGDP